MHRVKRLTDVHAVSSLKVSLIFFCLYLLFAASFLLLHSHLLFVFLCTCCTLTFLSLPPIIVPHLYLSFYPCSFFIFFVSLNLFTPFPLFFLPPLTSWIFHGFSFHPISLFSLTWTTLFLILPLRLFHLLLLWPHLWPIISLHFPLSFVHCSSPRLHSLLLSPSFSVVHRRIYPPDDKLLLEKYESLLSAAFQTFLAGRAASLQKEMNNPLKRMKARTSVADCHGLTHAHKQRKLQKPTPKHIQTLVDKQT